MITLNGKEFAECKKAITKTCVGYFKKYSRQIKIFNRYDKLIGVTLKSYAKRFSEANLILFPMIL